jgi:hypothetical protein
MIWTDPALVSPDLIYYLVAHEYLPTLNNSYITQLHLPPSSPGNWDSPLDDGDVEDLVPPALRVPLRRQPETATNLREYLDHPFERDDTPTTGTGPAPLARAARSSMRQWRVIPTVPTVPTGLLSLSDDDDDDDILPGIQRSNAVRRTGRSSEASQIAAHWRSAAENQSISDLSEREIMDAIFSPEAMAESERRRQSVVEQITRGAREFEELAARGHEARASRGLRMRGADDAGIDDDDDRDDAEERRVGFARRVRRRVGERIPSVEL